MQEKHGYFIEDLSVGMTAVFAKTVTDADITMFAGISGDTNPVHLDQSFAEKTMFKGRIAHGMLSASFISTVFGTRLPGPGCIYLRQDLRFKAPVKIGDTVQARVTVKEIQMEKKRVVFDTVCTVGTTTVLEGEATLMVASRRETAGSPEANDAGGKDKASPKAPQAAE
jgi:3-hydroxybutyryl-CoA dehydratase